MRKSILASAVGSAALLLAGAALAAGAPPPFAGNATVDGTGKVTFGASDPCGAAGGYKCSIIATGANFAQMEMTSKADPTVSYYATVMSQTGAGGASFSDESYVRSGPGAPQGVYDKLSVIEPLTGLKSSTSEMRTGWASDAGTEKMANVKLGLEIESDAGTGKSFSSTFTAETVTDSAITDPLKQTTVKLLTADQVTYLGSTTDKQHFFTAIKTAAADSNGAQSFVGGKTDVIWKAGDKLQVVWIGQDMPSTPSAGTFGTAQIVLNDGVPFPLTGPRAGDNVMITRTSMAETGPFAVGNTAAGFSTTIDATITLPAF